MMLLPYLPTRPDATARPTLVAGRAWRGPEPRHLDSGVFSRGSSRRHPARRVSRIEAMMIVIIIVIVIVIVKKHRYVGTQYMTYRVSQSS